MAENCGHRSLQPALCNGFDPMDMQYNICGSRTNIKVAACWVNIGQAAVAVLELLLFIAFYLIDWSDPDMSNTFSSQFLIFGVCLFIVNLFFAGALHMGLRYESSGMIMADFAWMVVSTGLRALSVVLLIVELINYPGSASWLSAGLIASLASLIIQCLSCYILAQCAYFFRCVRTTRQRTEALAAAGVLLARHWRSPINRPGDHPSAPPPPYAVATLEVPPSYETATETVRTGAR